MVPLQLRDQRIGPRAAPAQRVEEKPVLLGVVHALGEGIEVIQHRAEYFRIDLGLALPDLSDQMLHAVQYRSDRAVLGADDVQSLRHDALLACRSAYFGGLSDAF